jgi:hypothetical protein
MTHTVHHHPWHHTVDHSEDQAPAATHDVTASAAAGADDPVLSAEEVSGLLGGVPRAMLAVEAWLEAWERKVAAWMGM